MLKTGEIHWRAFDGPVFLIVMTLMVVGAVFVSSATYDTPNPLAGKQIIWVTVALFGLLAGMLVPYTIWLEYSYVLYFGVISLLLYLLFFGERTAGARSWLHFGGLSFQPSEVAKIIVILACANFIRSLEDEEVGIKELVILWAIALIPMVLTALQPDFGTATAFLPTIATVLYLSRFPLSKILKWSGIGLVAILIILAIGWATFFKPYQKERIRSFLDSSYDPLGAGYQVNQARIAVGSGELLGKGLRSGTQNRLSFLPKPHTDFIYGVVAEETGFLGSTMVLALFLALLLRLLEIARTAREQYGRFLVVGIFALVLYHLLINVGMVLGLLPTTGIPLPFLSYGGSALLTMGWAMGLVLNVGLRRYTHE